MIDRASEQQRYKTLGYLFLVALFAILGLADGIITWYVLRLGVGFELNPLLANLDGSWILIKGVFTALAVWWLVAKERRVAAYVLTIAMAIVVMWNALVLGGVL